MAESETQSPRPAAPLWLILLTLLGGAFLIQRGRNPAEDKAAPAPEVDRGESVAAATAPEDRMLAPLREFLGLPVQPAKAVEPEVIGKLKLERRLPDGSRVRASAEWVGKTPAPDGDNRQAELKKRIESHVGLLEFLIVTVADPIDTATNLRFDLQLDTLHKALGADGYVPDHYYLPWGPPGKDKDDVHRTEPGVLLYRRNGESECKCKEDRQVRTDLLLVYLVGETPTSGIHKEAFLKAVKQIKALVEMAPCRKPCSKLTIRIAGPLFTGAADSLALAIRQVLEEMEKEEKCAKEKVEFQVITGAAVSVDRERFLALAGERHVDFHATVLHGDILKQALISHVVDRTRSKPVRIAWLTETGTGYGSSISFKYEEEAREIRMRQPAPSPPPPVQSTSQSEAEIIEFRFPVNISKVRSGYAESRRRERSGQASLGPESSRLPIPFEDASTARDVPPMQTPQVTAPTAELILGQILTTIRSAGIRYVGISSSDPRDAIFLAELIQEQCPDAQIMLVTSDVLHLSSEYRSIMHGTLVSSTYPLHPEAQDLCFPFGEYRGGNSRSIVLPSQANYGLYNAVLFLRGLERGQYVHLPHMDDYGNNNEPANLLTLSSSHGAGWPGGLPLVYSLPFEERIVGACGRLRPPVWISRIGSTGICPITVRATDNVEGYTLELQIDEKDSERLPARHFRGHVPASLYIASLVWLVIAAIYCAAIVFPKRVGNWAKALATGADSPQEFQALIYVFRALITASFLSVLTMFAGLLGRYYDWIGRGLGDHMALVQYRLCYSVEAILVVCLVADWVGALLCIDTLGEMKRLVSHIRISHLRRVLFGILNWLNTAMKGLVSHLRISHLKYVLFGILNWLNAAMKRLITYLRGRLARTIPGTAAQAAKPDLSWHLIGARGIGLAMILALVVIYISQIIGQETGEGKHLDRFMWFLRNRDMWNGLSAAMTAQLLAVALIILSYGMLLQMHLLSPEFTIIRLDPSTSTPPGDDERRTRQEEVRNALLFPLLSRWRRGRPVILDILCVAAVLLWLGFLGWHIQSPDHYVFIFLISFPIARLLFVGGFWCVRMFKLILILNGLARQLKEMTRALRERWPEDWPKIFELLAEKPVGLQELFWTSRPTKDDEELSNANQALQSGQLDAAGRRKAEQKLCAVEIDLYVRQFFHHIGRLGLGLAVAACLLFLSAHTFPFSQEPLVRLSASVMLAAIGCVMAWYYLKFDRNELLSYLVGTDPKHVSINWSLVQMVAPAVLLTAVALLSQTFPEIWQWLRNVLEPMARSSI